MFSLNEIDTLCKRAARGAGLPWGLAEEAGKASRWLAAHQLPGPEALAELLLRIDGIAPRHLLPNDTDGVWRARAGQLCPVSTGAAMCDRATDIARGHVFVLGPTLQPLLLIPFAAAAASLSNAAVGLTWPGVQVVVSASTMSVQGDNESLITPMTQRVQCQLENESESKVVALNSRRDITQQAWQRLQQFAARILAPSSDASRVAGAGAGLKDND